MLAGARAVAHAGHVQNAGGQALLSAKGMAANADGSTVDVLAQTDQGMFDMMKSFLNGMIPAMPVPGAAQYQHTDEADGLTGHRLFRNTEHPAAAVSLAATQPPAAAAQPPAAAAQPPAAAAKPSASTVHLQTASQDTSEVKDTQATDQKENIPAAISALQPAVLTSPESLLPGSNAAELTTRTTTTTTTSNSGSPTITSTFMNADTELDRVRPTDELSSATTSAPPTERVLDM